MLLLGWRELELKVGGDVCVCVGRGVIAKGLRGRGSGLGAPPSSGGTDISGQVVLEQ